MAPYPIKMRALASLHFCNERAGGSSSKDFNYFLTFLIFVGNGLVVAPVKILIFFLIIMGADYSSKGASKNYVDKMR